MDKPSILSPKNILLGQLPSQYSFLALEGGPRILLEFLKIYGVIEKPGSGDNPVILSWAKEMGVANIYKHDLTPWCGLAMGIAAKRAGKEFPKELKGGDILGARNWTAFGKETPIAMLGDVLVFKRTGGAHVGIYVAEDAECYHVLAGNQGDKVSISRWNKCNLYAVRRPKYINQPSNVRRIILDNLGEVHDNFLSISERTLE